jgi:hypothetical protein
MAHAAGFDNDADDKTKDIHLGKPYSRKSYHALAHIKKLKDRAIGPIDRNTFLSPRYRDIRAYLHNNLGAAEIDTSLVACSHATSPAQCRLARASMVQANKYTGLSLNQRLRALARTPSFAMGTMAHPSLVTFLAKRLARKISRNSTDRDIDDSDSHMVRKYATNIQKRRSPSPDKGGRKSRKSHKSRSRKNLKSRKNRNL